MATRQEFTEWLDDFEDHIRGQFQKCKKEDREFMGLQLKEDTFRHAFIYAPQEMWELIKEVGKQEGYKYLRYQEMTDPSDRENVLTLRFWFRNFDWKPEGMYALREALYGK